MQSKILSTCSQSLTLSALLNNMLKSYLSGVLWAVTLSLSDPLLGFNGLLCCSCCPNPSRGINNTSAVIASTRYTNTHLTVRFTKPKIQCGPSSQFPGIRTNRWWRLLMPKLKTKTQCSFMESHLKCYARIYCQLLNYWHILFKYATDEMNGMSDILSLNKDEALQRKSHSPWASSCNV